MPRLKCLPTQSHPQQTQVCLFPVWSVIVPSTNGELLFFCSSKDSDADDEIEDLLAYFEQQLTLESSFPKICAPELEMTQTHISGGIGHLSWGVNTLSQVWLMVCVLLAAALPREILMYIFRWVVSSDLDMRTLEQLSLVCRGFYICARWSCRSTWRN